MEAGSLKGLEFVLIVGVVVWFYFAQTRNLRKLKDDRDAKQAQEKDSRQQRDAVRPPTKERQ
ncbi:MAG: hypothetical protein WBG92_05005 [Thiohalocapsa sp.]